MSYYPALKQRLTCREVAPRYGLKVNASGMALCPFHDEHSPSLKLSRGFHCFGCGAQGDVITFVSRLFGIPPGEAAQKLSADFGIPAGDHSRGPPAARTEMETWISYAKEILHGYYDLLIDWKQRYCPKALDEEWHPLFIEALQRHYEPHHRGLGAGDNQTDSRIRYPAHLAQKGWGRSGAAGTTGRLVSRYPLSQ